MPRERADDYDAKINTIKDAAAKLFSKTGYSSAKLIDIAKACGASKSMLYHYFPTKDDLLFSMIEEHLQTIITSLEQVRVLDLEPEAKFNTFLENYLQRSAHARQRNIVAMNEVKYLPPPLQKSIFKLEEKVLDLITDQLQDLKPGLPKALYKPYALLLIGMLNWTDTWYNPKGNISNDQLIERVSSLFLHGFYSTQK